MSAFIEFKNDIINKGLEYIGLYYGTYEGIVIDNDDTDGLGRLKIYCPAVWGDDKEVNIWARPKGLFAGKKIGFHALPQKDDVIWVTFQYGKADLPLWEYGWWLKDEGIKDVNKDQYILVTPKGHTFLIDEKEDIIKFFFKDGKGVYIDKNKIYLAKENANVPAVLGDKNADLHKDVIQLIIDIIQAIQTAPVVPMDGGASFKAGLIASLTTTLVNANLYKSTNADETKSDVVFLE